MALTFIQSKNGIYSISHSVSHQLKSVFLRPVKCKMLVIFIQIFLLLLYVLVLSLEDMCLGTLTVELLFKNIVSLSVSVSCIFHIFILSVYLCIPI